MKGVSSPRLPSLCVIRSLSYGFATTTTTTTRKFRVFIIVVVLFEVQTNKFSILLDYLRTRTT